MTRKNYINVIAQQLYGNRTGTQICKDKINFFLKGSLSPELFPGDDKTVAQTIVRIPNNEHIVIVYDQAQEDKYVNVEFPEIYALHGADYRKRWGKDLKMKVSCKIPEIGLTIHTRCFACRMNSTGNLEDIQPEDYSIVLRYLSE